MSTQLDGKNTHYRGAQCPRGATLGDNKQASAEFDLTPARRVSDGGGDDCARKPFDSGARLLQLKQFGANMLRLLTAEGFNRILATRPRGSPFTVC